MDRRRKCEMDHFTVAAKQLLGTGDSLRPHGIPETHFAAGDPLSMCCLSAHSAAAAAHGMDFIYLEFGPGTVKHGPRRLIVSMFREETHTAYDGCALWAPKSGGRLLIVPGRGAPGHFGFDHDEVVHLPGMPGAIREGRARATLRLKALVATMSSQQGKLSVKPIVVFE